MPRLPRSPRAVACALALLGASLWTLYAGAWIVDDAHITFRTVDHFVHGRGLVWNPGERVQAFTHPLWMFMVSGAYAVTGELFYTVILGSMIVALAALTVGAFGYARGGAPAALFVVSCLAGKAIMDYTSSGLENALSYLLVTIFACVLREAVADRARPLWVVFLGALAFVNRADTLIVYLPGIAWVAWRARAAFALPALRGALPALLWLAFATLYFGFPLPNTYYAKVAAGVPLADRLTRGLLYLVDSLSRDPASWCVLGIATACAWRARRRLAEAALLVAGAGAYVAFAITQAATTHMSGRFFALPLFAGALALAVTLAARWHAWVVAALIGATLISPVAPWKMGTRLYHRPAHEDESRIDTAWHAHEEGSVLWPSRARAGAHAWLLQGRRFAGEPERVRLGGAGEAVGFFGFAAGPDKTIIDIVGVTEPLLARLPACNTASPRYWKSGHFYREPPAGYLASRVQGRNLLEDAALHAYYERLDRVLRGPLFDRQRLLDILWLNLVAPSAPVPRPPAGDCRAQVWRAREELARLQDPDAE